MCGIAAILSTGGQENRPLISSMVKILDHRGPDERDIWLNRGVALGHARLSIVELSPSGAQPMSSRDGRWILVFNGEIYNHQFLRESLSGPWRGHSDTETLVEAIAAWGVEEALQRCLGMFAIAIWDIQEQCLWLARDRMGEKPLYYGIVSGQFCAASELKALLADGARPEIDRDSLALFLRHSCIPAPYTIWQGIHKLLPGHVLRVPLDGCKAPLSSRAYWSVDVCLGQSTLDIDDDAAVDMLDGLLRQAVAGQMVADVELGAFLSGGVDSSAIVALMQAQSSRPIRTFTIGFADRNFDESDHAAAVARHLGTDHTSMIVGPSDALASIPDLPCIWDEPFSDSSQIPMLLLSRLTRKHVAVALSGDAGDELFAGYNRYKLLNKMRRFQRCIPRLLRLGLARGITAVPPRFYDLLMSPMSGLRRAGDKLHKLAGVLGEPSIDSLYRNLISHWSDPGSVVINGREPRTILTNGRSEFVKDPLSRFQYLDQLSYLPDDILVKVDRAAMCASLETRVPFLDHRVVAFSWSLPERMKLRGGQGKWILRKVLDRYVPRHLIDRPKMGFGIPLDSWLRGPLRSWAESLLAEDRLHREGFFHPEPIRQKWTEHLSGRRNWQYHLWDVLMFQAWRERWH